MVATSSTHLEIKLRGVDECSSRSTQPSHRADTVNTSDVSFVAILSQRSVKDEHPIAFLPKNLPSTEKYMKEDDQELLE